ncbi:MAG: hypothetical protein ACXW0Q_05705 [Methylovulum sp.]
MKIIILAMCVSLFGCTSASVSSSLSSGVVGCPSDKIKITDETASIRGTHEWVAECKGKKYICSYVYGSNTNCTEAKNLATISPEEDCANRRRYNSTLVCPTK